MGLEIRRKRCGISGNFEDSKIEFVRGVIFKLLLIPM